MVSVNFRSMFVEAKNIAIIDQRYLGRETSSTVSIEHSSFIILRGPAGPVGPRVPQKVDGTIGEHPRYQLTFALLILQITDTSQ